MFERNQKDLIPISNSTRDYTRNPTINYSKLDNQANLVANSLLTLVNYRYKMITQITLITLIILQVPCREFCKINISKMAEFIT